MARALFLVVPPKILRRLRPFCPGIEKYRKEAPVDAKGVAVWSLTVISIRPRTSDPTLRAGSP